MNCTASQLHSHSVHQHSATIPHHFKTWNANNAPDTWSPQHFPPCHHSRPYFLSEPCNAQTHHINMNSTEVGLALTSKDSCDMWVSKASFI